MSNVTQIYSLVNGAVSDFLGTTGPRVTDTTSFVDLGRTLDGIFNADNPYQGYDGFFGALVSRIAKTEIFVRLYEQNTRRVITDYIEFGAFVSRIYTTMPDAVANPTWSVSNGQNPPTLSPHSPYNVSGTVAVSQKIFGKKGTWSIEINIPIVQVKSAFLNESQMGAFIDSIYMTIANSLAVELEALENTAVNTAIANAIHNGQATNLLQVYNQENTGVSLTVSTCLKDLKFIAFSNKQIANMRGYMKKMSGLYNSAGYKTFTPEGKSVLEVLTEFASASKFYLESNSYNANLVALEGYQEVPYWQSPGTTAYDFESSSTIDIKNFDVYNSGSPAVAVEVKQSGVLACLRDEDCVKAYFGQRRAWEEVNKRDDTVVHGEKAEIGYALEPKANCWVFYIDD